MLNPATASTCFAMLYGHLFQNIEADRAYMAKIEAAARAV